jgi:hypothetical protein
MLVTMLPSHAGDGTAGVTWLQRDVDVESCWRQCCRVMLAVAPQLKVALVVVRLRSSQDRSIEMLSHDEEVRYLCWLVAE